MAKKRSKKSPARYFIGLIVVFVLMSGFLTILKTNGVNVLAGVDQNLAAAGILGTSTTPVVCTDSDGGKDYNVKGTTSGLDGAGVPTTRVDSCVGSRLIEWFCYGNKVPNTNYTCPTGCLDGACKSSGPMITVLNDRLSLNSPVGRTVKISTTTITPKVTLGVYGLKSTGKNASIFTLVFKINGAGTALQNFRLVSLSGTRVASSYSSDGTLVFTGFSNPLVADAWKDFTLIADVAPTTSSMVVTATLLGNQTVGVDASYNALDVSKMNDIMSNNLTLASDLVTVSGIIVSKNVVNGQSGVWSKAYSAFTFTLTNSGNNPLFVSKKPHLALATSTSAGKNASSTVSDVMVAPGSDIMSGDTFADYVIPVNASRTFTYSFVMDNANGTTAGKKLSITKIFYGPAGSDTINSITAGLSGLFVQVP